MSGCENVRHDAVDCKVAGVPHDEWCQPCLDDRTTCVSADDQRVQVGAHVSYWTFGETGIGRSLLTTVVRKRQLVASGMNPYLEVVVADADGNEHVMQFSPGDHIDLII